MPTVFFARFIAFLRITSAWIAGISRMTWWRFLFYECPPGGIVWATVVGVIAYRFGDAAVKAIDKYGLLGAVGVRIVLVIAYLAFRFWKKRLLRNAEISSHSSPRKTFVSDWQPAD